MNSENIIFCNSNKAQIYCKKSTGEYKISNEEQMKQIKSKFSFEKKYYF